MSVHDIAHVELYTREKVSTVDYFVSAMGFTCIADCVEVDRSSALLQQGDVQLVVTSGRGIWKFLDRHGDGIADIALTCDDVQAARDAAVAAGAREAGTPYGAPAVSAFGDVVHTLLPAAGRTPGDLPPGRRWVRAPQAAQAPDPAIRLLDHVAVCLDGGTLEEQADFYRDAFGFARYSSEYVAVGGQAMDSLVVRSASERVILTLVAPDPGKDPGQLDAFLERNAGPGVQHLAFRVDDVIGAVRAFRDQGVEFLRTPETYYDMLADRLPELAAGIAGLRDAQVLVDSDEWGHLLQLFTRSPHERNTLFYELIQRQGSRGFGSANIRALYEAVERDRLTAP
ncbi:4-hydroxyphenylpyruvate dioxygenase [Streptomyces sp. TRM S81-3]|uniref:4-hydroxyphenylpyruvate dioxygenase n=1 Tax=Streptomyces griseicoloratus TaxID=2752516 RepID=A0A926QU60_9ACTN|nr:4-hydroxyphenylpyruvate dioxygenase [Streptomyces griseicoloratus]MBD0423938.1 4-hydroxyphenylpyruvate dioxygenase [Streptomyces griseicoloratus]